MRIDEFDDVIAYEVADKAIPSISYVLFDTTQIVALKHVARTGELRRDAMFRIGSVSKTFAALAAMQLVERGQLSLDADIATYIPGFTPTSTWGGGPITLRKLLSHRSGLTREAKSGGYLDDRGPPLSATVEGLAKSTLKAPSDGSAYFYSNAGFAVIGRAIENVAGRSYAEHLRQSVLAPLGLDDTTIALSPAIEGRLAPALMWTADRDYAAPVFDLGSAPAGNVFSTLEDLAAYGQALLRGSDGIITPQTLARMWTPAVPDAPRPYGLGFHVEQLDGKRSIGHGGVVYGYATAFTLLPDVGLGIAMVSTLDFTNELIGRLSRRALRLALAERGQGVWPKAPRKLARPGVNIATEIAGAYTTTDGAAIELRAAGTRLIIVDEGVPLEIRPIGQNRFVLDGRIFGEETTHPYPTLEVPEDGVLRWKGREWRRTDEVAAAAPTELARYLGTYAPDFMPTYLRISNGKLMCLIENFCPHVCDPIGGNRYMMRGSLYEREVFELGVIDEAGRPAIKVGEVILSKRDD